MTGATIHDPVPLAVTATTPTSSLDGRQMSRLRATPNGILYVTGAGAVAGVDTRLTARSPSVDDVNDGTPVAQDSACFLYAHNNDTSWNRLRIASALAMSTAQAPSPLLVSDPGEWAAVSQPAVSVIASATRAAGGAGVRHVCRSITVTSSGPAPQTSVDVVLRDGASGAGAILWVGSLAFVAGDSKSIILSGLHIVGSANTAMTLEFQAAPVATNFQRTTLNGHDVV